jgi:hypothetical protein
VTADAIGARLNEHTAEPIKAKQHTYKREGKYSKHNAMMLRRRRRRAAAAAAAAAVLAGAK